MRRIGAIFVWVMIIAAMGCCRPPTEPERRLTDVKVVVPLKIAAAEGVSTVRLIVTDRSDNILVAQNLEISGEEATGTVSVPLGQVIFTVRLLDENNVLLGEVQQEVDISETAIVQIEAIAIRYIHRSTRDISLTVTWKFDEGPCRSIPALFINGAVYVYRDAGSITLNRFIPSGFMGDTADIEYVDDNTDEVYSGKTSARISYVPSGSQEWAGIYFQSVGNNWGDHPFGVYLTGAKRLIWYARGLSGEGKVEFIAGGIETGPCPDSLPKKSTGTLVLSTEWTKYEIDLSTDAGHLNHIVGGFGVTFTKRENPDGITLFIDDVKFQTE